MTTARRRGILAAAAVAIAAAIAVPLLAGGPVLDDAALACALAGPAAATALAVAAGRPVLTMSATAGAAGYLSGQLALHGVAVPLAVVAAALAGAAVAAAVAVMCARIDGQAVLVATLLLVLAAAAGARALPGVTGAEAGLGPLPGLSLPLEGDRTAVLTPTGDLHLLLLAATAIAVGASLLLGGRPGARWRAIGSDRDRAAGSGVRVLAGEVAALACGGAMAGLTGALAAHVSRVATPAELTPEVAALPLLAALATRAEPLAAAAAAVATGVLGLVVLPELGWRGPPDAMLLALAVLALAAVYALLPGTPRARRTAEAVAVDAAAPWPLEGLGLRGATLDVAAVTVRSPAGVPLVEAPPLHVGAGTVQAVVGANGAGKSTLLRAIARGGASVTLDGGAAPGVVLLPQHGGGFDTCTVAETLAIAARRGRGAEDAGALAAAWLERLGLGADRDRRCEQLSAGTRRLVDLARALLAGPSVLLCDEPLAGLDDRSREAAVALLRAAAAAGLTVVVAEHDLPAVTRIAAATLVLERPGDSAAAAAPA